MRRIDLDTITFEFGPWEVTPDQYHKLERMARAMLRVLERNPDEVFLIEGHTDAVGSDVDNLSLSDRRARRWRRSCRSTSACRRRTSSPKATASSILEDRHAGARAAQPPRDVLNVAGLMAER